MKSDPDSLKRLINLYPNRSKKREHKSLASRMRVETFLQIPENKRIKKHYGLCFIINLTTLTKTTHFLKDLKYQNSLKKWIT